MELKLKNITSYKKDSFTTLNLSKKINIIYGHNGCGKSTISNFFYNTKNTDYNECECSLLENFRPLVYNSKFIEDNFYNTKEQKGVFTLSKENADIERQLLEKEALRKELGEQYKNKQEIISKLQQERDNKETDTIESVWVKTEAVRASDLKILMRGQVGSKRVFFTQVKKTPRIPGINLESLASEYSELLKHKNKEIPLIPSLTVFSISREDSELLSTPIIDSSNSYLSENIKKLQNLDWIKKGKEFYINGKSCPFCQEDTITTEFKEAIESIFDETYSRKVEKIALFKSAYEMATEQHLKKIAQDIASCEIIDEKEKEVTISHIRILEKNADKNSKLILEKINNPSTNVILTNDTSTEEKVISYIDAYNEKIKEINIKVNKFKESENSIKNKVWGAIRDFCNHELELLSKHDERHEANLGKESAELINISSKGEENTIKIRELRNQISNIDATIDSINLRLKNLGIYGFSIKKHNKSEDKYIISRSETVENQDVYKSLSEGEKTLITFLYFLECCKGRTDKNDSDMRNSFIVIDDPISSLSQNYVYDIASIIHHEIIKNEHANKVLILTHNLYFFHELIKLAPESKEDRKFKRDYYLARVTKNEFSIITEIDKSSIQNEYQSLWQVLKDAKEGRVNRIIIPNIMRNILEYYFAFVHRTDALQDELINLANDDNNSDFRAFYRYINRGSHSDAINITDMGDIDPEKYIGQLKKIFSITGHEKHYLKMMDAEDEEEVVTA
ncbi:AAA family ATPase [Serratia marcescens]|uniref:AAA family ATPase n=1 Tax=Serratia marcescens TaxID=615 RepID=UPI001F2A5EAF|nr:AAA family ATPase [Serratia marcescens]UIM53711.1 AAA family ATPase [Serratia marcescens]